MTVESSPPSRNPADNDSIVGMMRLTLTKFLQNVDDMLPARVIAYDRSTNLAALQPLINIVTTNNKQVPRAQIAAVPVLQLGGGGFVLSFPIKNGDYGWIKANDRDISLFKQSEIASPPNTQRKHSFEDAMFIPDIMFRDTTIATEDQNNAVFQNLDGTVKIALWSEFIKIIAAKGVGIGGTPDENAILDLQSTTQAFKPPRMTTAQRNAIPHPTEGMIVWNLTTHGLSSYNGSIWS